MPTSLIATLADVEREARIPLAERRLPTSTYELLCRAAERYADHIALQFLPQGSPDEAPVVFSYGEFVAQVTQTANLFHRLGLGQDDAAAFILPNVPQTHLALWGGEAACRIGAVNPLLEPGQLVGILRAMNANVLVTLGPDGSKQGLWEKIVSLADRVPSLQTILTVDLAPLRAATGSPGPPASERLGPAWVLDFDRERAREPGDRLVSGRRIRSTDWASLFHTGGTTGLPKIAPHTHGNEVFSAWNIALGVGLQAGEVVLCGLPLFHVNAALVTGLAVWWAGAQVILAGAAGYRTPGMVANFWRLVERYRVTYCSAVPTLYAALLEVPVQGADLSSLRYGVCGAAPLPPGVFRRFEALTGVKLLEGYGLTEGTCASTVNPPAGERRIGSIGLPLPYQQLRVARLDEHGQITRFADTDEIGLLVMRGPQVFPGYLREPDNQGAWPMDRVGNRWLNTGDLARIDADGYIWLTGRTKEVIIRGGHNLDPHLIEETLCQHPAVALAAAVGQPDAYAGELPRAYVTLRAGAQAKEADLLAFAAAQLPERAAVPVCIRIVPDLPMTAVGKIFKPALRYIATDDVYRDALAARGIEATVKTGPDETLGTVAQIELKEPAQRAQAEAVLAGFAVPVRFLS